MREKPSLIISLAAAVLAVLAACGLHLALLPLLGDRAPFLIFGPALFVLALWGGLRPIFAAALLSVPVLAYFVLEPRNTFAIGYAGHRAGLVVWVILTIGVGWLSENLAHIRRLYRLAAERAVAERERLRVTLESIGDAVIVTDERGTVESLNVIAESLTGWTHEQARGAPLSQVFRIVNEDTRLPVEDPGAKVLRIGAIVGLANHTLLIARDGSERPIDDSAAPIRDEDGRVRGVVIVFRDVTAKRQAEKRLARSEHELADFFDNAALGLHWVGPDGTILRVNQAELDMLGYRRDEYVGHHVSEFHADKQKIEGILARLSNGEVLHDYEAQLVHKDGSIKDVLITSSVLWEDGQFVHTRCFTRDVSDRKQAESALSFLAEASVSLAALVDRESALQQAARLAVPYLADWCVVYVVDERGEIDYHAHAHHDPSKEQQLAEMLTMSPLDWSSNTATVRSLKTGESQLMDELPEPFLDNVAQSEKHREIIRELNPQSVISVPLKIRDRTIGVLGLVSCDSRRHYAQRDLRLAEDFAQRVATAVDNSRLFHAVKQSSRQKDEFLAMLAHELRNPLAAIRYAVVLGQMSDIKPADSDELFEIVDRQTQNLAHLIDDLLDVSRISRDRITLRKGHVEVSKIIHQAATTVQPQIEEKHHELVLDIADEPIRLYADPTRTEQIVVNLLTNAVKYTPPGGRLAVRALREGENAVIQVSDNGIGLPPEMLGRVFDLFAQADRTLDRSEGGLGIGLTVAKKLTEMHGGTIFAASEGLNKGTTFTVRMPLSQAPADGDGQPAAAAAAAQKGRRWRVLVVDDNRDTARSCALLVKTLGHEVELAFDGFEAVEQARKFKPHVLLLDIGLPGMNGYEVARALRAEGFRKARMIAISGYGQSEDRERSNEAGFDDHLVKPVDHATLVAALQSIDDIEAVPT